jgi:hypothetical protein
MVIKVPWAGFCLAGGALAFEDDWGFEFEFACEFAGELDFFFRFDFDMLAPLG